MGDSLPSQVTGDTAARRCRPRLPTPLPTEACPAIAPVQLDPWQTIKAAPALCALPAGGSSSCRVQSRKDPRRSAQMRLACMNTTPAHTTSSQFAKSASTRVCEQVCAWRRAQVWDQCLSGPSCSGVPVLGTPAGEHTAGSPTTMIPHTAAQCEGRPPSQTSLESVRSLDLVWFDRCLQGEEFAH